MVYKMSNKTLKERMANSYLFMVAMPLIILIFYTVFSSRYSSSLFRSPFLEIIIVTTFILVLEMYIVAKITLKKIATITILVHERGFDRFSGKKTEHFIFSDLHKVKILNHRSKSHKTIIKGKMGRKAFVISGFEGMEYIQQAFKEHSPLFEEKDQKIDWSSPWVMVLSLIVSTGLMAVIIGIGGQFHEYFSRIAQISFGLLILFGRPLSKSSGERFRKFEIIVGGLMSLAALGLIVMKIII